MQNYGKVKAKRVHKQRADNMASKRVRFEQLARKGISENFCGPEIGSKRHEAGMGVWCGFNTP